jgi:hypothetical protein
MRPLHKYTKIYSGGEPELVEGYVFRTTVPLSLIGASNNAEAKKYMRQLIPRPPGK